MTLNTIRCTIAEHLIATGHTNPATDDVDKHVDHALHARTAPNDLRPLTNAYHRLTQTLP